MTGGKLFQILRPAIVGGAADFKVGYKRGFASGASGKKFVPPLFTNMGYKQANMSRELKFSHLYSTE